MTVTHTAAHPTPAQTVGALHAGMLVALVGGGVLAVISAAALLRQRRSESTGEGERLEARELEPLEQAA
jgi:hypothetical protein